MTILRVPPNARSRARSSVARTRRPKGALESRGPGGSNATRARRLRSTAGEISYPLLRVPSSARPPDGRPRARPTVARTRRPTSALESRGRGASDAPQGRRLRPTVGALDVVVRGRVVPNFKEVIRAFASCVLFERSSARTSDRRSHAPSFGCVGIARARRFRRSSRTTAATDGRRARRHDRTT